MGTADDIALVKLYKRDGDALRYWETWEHGGTNTLHWGTVGDEGDTTTLKTTKSARDKVRAELAARKAEGYAEVPVDGMAMLVVEYKVEGFGNEADLAKRDRLESLLDNVLGWTGLGHCDGGSTGSGTMEAASYVVDFAIAKKLIEEELADTEFADFTRIYREDS
jgi:hypothetical protein